MNNAIGVGGSRWFIAGIVLLALFGLGHFMGFLEGRKAARTDPAMADLTRAMQDKRVHLMGFSPSLLDFREYFSVNFSILMWVAAALSLAAWRLSGDPAAAIRLVSLVNAAAMIVLLATSLIYSVAQGVVSCATIFVVFVIAWLRAG